MSGLVVSRAEARALAKAEDMLALDPCVGGAAGAYFSGGALLWTADLSTAQCPGRYATVCAFEQPQFDGRVHVHTIELAVAGALLAGYCGRYVCPLEVRKWKGSEKKPQHHLRMLKALRESELAILDREFGGAVAQYVETACRKGAKACWKTRTGKSKPGAAFYGSTAFHNRLDAVALGLFVLGRIDAQGCPL